MAKKTKDDGGKDVGFPQKYEKLISDWVGTAEAMDTDGLKKTIVDCQKSISETGLDMENDEHLNSLREELKIVTGGYKDVIKREDAKTRFCVHLLKSRGIA